LLIPFQSLSSKNAAGASFLGSLRAGESPKRKGRVVLFHTVSSFFARYLGLSL
jgi:hypothetical protein